MPSPFCFHEICLALGKSVKRQKIGMSIMRISARNVLKGTVIEVTKGQTTAHIRIDIGGAVVTSSITNEAVDELGLKVGMVAAAVIKASDVMVAVE